MGAKHTLPPDIQRLAAQTRERLLAIWDGDTERADQIVCHLMRCLKDLNASRSPKDRVSDAMMERVLFLMAQMIQRSPGSRGRRPIRS